MTRDSEAPEVQAAEAAQGLKLGREHQDKITTITTSIKTIEKDVQ